MWGKANNDSLAGSLRLFALQTTEGSLDMTAALQTVFFLLLWNERTSSRCVTLNWWQWCEGATQLSAVVFMLMWCLSRHQAVKFFKYVRTFSVCSRSRVNVAESFLGHRSLGAPDGKGSLSGVLEQRWWHSLWRTEVAERRSWNNPRKSWWWKKHTIESLRCSEDRLMRAASHRQTAALMSLTDYVGCATGENRYSVVTVRQHITAVLMYFHGHKVFKPANFLVVKADRGVFPAAGSTWHSTALVSIQPVLPSPEGVSGMLSDRSAVLMVVCLYSSPYMLGLLPRASFETELKLIHSGDCWDSSRCCQSCHTNHFQITLGMFVVKSLLVPHCSARMGDCTDCFYFVLKLSLLWHDSEIYSESVVMIHVFALYNIMLQMRFYIAFSLLSAHYNEITKFVKIAYQDWNLQHIAVRRVHS